MHMNDDLNLPDIDEILNSLKVSLPTDTSQNLTENESKELQLEVDAHEENYIKELKESSVGIRKNTIKILVVDDSKVIYTKIKHILSSFNVHLDHAQSGNQAIDVLQKIKDYHLITMDINMPGLNGIDTIKQLLERDCTIPFIIMSTESEKNQITEALLLGVKQYIVKPFTDEQVIDRIKQVLQEYNKTLETI